MKLKLLIPILVIGAALALPVGVASAHHTTITCIDRASSSWSIVNSENLSMTFTTNQGHSGSIGPRGTATVTYSGTSLTVYGVWSNGNRNTSTGQGNCVPVATTSTTSTTTSTTTTTTEPEQTTTTAPEPTVPPSTFVECVNTPEGCPPESPPMIPPTINEPATVAVGQPPIPPTRLPYPLPIGATTTTTVTPLAPTLPETGPAEDRMRNTLLAGISLIALGGAALIARRR